MEQLQEETKTIEMHFSISGEFITNTARDFLREGDWRRGFEFLTENIAGLDAQQALDILEGKLQLTGVNDLALEADTAEAEILKSLDWQHRGVFSFRGRNYRAYGTVHVLTQQDWQFATGVSTGRILSMSGNTLWRDAYAELSDKPKGFNTWSDYEEMLAIRPFFYARNPASDIKLVIDFPGAPGVTVLCEEHKVDLPLWYKVSKDAKAALLKAFNKRQLSDLTSDNDKAEAYQPTKEEQIQARDQDSGDDAQERQGSSQESWDTELLQSQASARKGVLVVNKGFFEEAEETESFYEKHAKILAVQVATEADNDKEYGWKEYTEFDEDAGRNVTIRVPHRAFICAALHRARAGFLMPEYHPRSPSGLKMPNDDRFHTDSWLGAGMKLEDAYDDRVPEQRLFMAKLYELQHEWLEFNFDVLARGKNSFVAGDVIHRPEEAGPDKVLVLGAADPRYADAAMRCKAVIVETGSKLAHLVIVSREEGIPVLRMENARKRFPEGRRVGIDLKEGKAELFGA